MAPAQAQQTSCAERSIIVEHLKQKYREAPTLVGITDGQNVMEFWGNPDKPSWTVVVTDVNGQSCLVASGGAFEILKPAVGEDG